MKIDKTTTLSKKDWTEEIDKVSMLARYKENAENFPSQYNKLRFLQS